MRLYFNVTAVLLDLIFQWKSTVSGNINFCNMNYNASAGARHPAQKPSKKKKHVSDTAAMGPPSYQPPYNPYTSSTPVYDVRVGAQQEYGFTQPGFNQNQGYTAGDQSFSLPTQFLSEPLVTNVAMHYGQALVGSGKQLVDRELEKYMPVSRLKYYFAVDTGYVTKKLTLLLFPFTHSDWSVKYEQNEPVQPRYEINAPDLYIPTMAYLTYVLVAGLVLGTQNRFSPEMLGIHASSALAWLLVEILIELIAIYITNIRTNLKTLDLVAYGGYKYVGIILAMLLSLVFHKTGYYVGLIYCGISLAFFLIRTSRIQILPEGSSPHQSDPYSAGSIGHKRRLYFVLFVAGIQPLLMWWLSAHLISPPIPKT